MISDGTDQDCYKRPLLLNLLVVVLIDRSATYASAKMITHSPLLELSDRLSAELQAVKNDLKAGLSYVIAVYVQGSCEYIRDLIKYNTSSGSFCVSKG